MCADGVPARGGRLALPGRRRAARLDNGLEIRVLERPGAGVVTTVLWYHAGSRDERIGRRGLAHFLEHMMFRGSSQHPSGAIDRLTVERGGDNNAFTSHDSTAYYFRFGADTWPIALELEADRMKELRFEREHLESERRVVLEEISMADNEPWDALETATLSAFYGDHPYGLPVLGSRADVAALESVDVHSFHRAYCRPGNGLLAVAGDVTLDRVLRVAAPLSRVAPAVGERRASVPRANPPRELLRVNRRHGDVHRLLLVLPAWTASDPRQALLRLLAGALTHGRQSRLHRRLVEERRLCSWVSADVAELEAAGHWSISLETLPGVAAERAEEALVAELRSLGRDQPLTGDEVARARQLLVTDWLFSLETVQGQALALAFEEAVAGRGWSEASIRQIASAEAADLATLITDLEGLDPERGAALGWSYAGDG